MFYGIIDITAPEVDAILDDYTRKAEHGETIENERRGLFIHQASPRHCVAIDNRDGDAWTEEFFTRSVAVDWLLDKLDTDEAHKEDAGHIFAIWREDIDASPARSAWGRGVQAYALELLEELEEAIDGGYFNPADITAPKLLSKQLLNGAADWSQYSWGGCSLIYDGDIAARLCTPSELKKTRNGERRPNAREEWLDTQARALNQAARLICRMAKQ